MKMNNNQQPLIQLDKAHLQQLCSEVKESVATDTDLKNVKHRFGVADLWNIHRTTRYRVQRRNMIR
jgi:hypothetical protein